MCLSRLVHIDEVDANGATAIGRSEGRTVVVSLAVLTLQGDIVIPGDWVQVSTGLAISRLTDEEAANIAAARAALAKEA